MEESDLMCYNKGCSKTFKINENDEKACQFHPGEPIFHDAYKIWSCCKKKNIDFTEFLNITGCTFGKHSTEKPKIKERKPEPINTEIKIEPQVPKLLKKEIVRSDYDKELTELKPIISVSLQKLIDEIPTNKESDNVVKEVDLIGKQCQNFGCQKIYSGDKNSDEGECHYHPGTAIFHEGSKYWSCCRKMTIDFDRFLNQMGCTIGVHDWTSKKTTNYKIRWDWHQTNESVIISIYVKDYSPNKSTIKVNPIRLSVNILLNDNRYFDLEFELSKLINVEKSKVNMFSTKIEVNLAKQGPENWNTLFYKQAPDCNECLTKPVTDPVDLTNL